MSRTIWDILAIPPTTNRREIQKAYAKLAKRYHPEEEPEKFQELQSAYQLALATLGSNQSFVQQSSRSFNPPTSDKPAFQETEDNKSGFNQSYSHSYDNRLEKSYDELEDDTVETTESVFKEEVKDGEFDGFFSEIDQLGQPLSLQQLKFIMTMVDKYGLLEKEGFRTTLDHFLSTKKWIGLSSDYKKMRVIATEKQLSEFYQKVYSLSQRKKSLKMAKKADAKSLDTKTQKKSRKGLFLLLALFMLFRAGYRMSRLANSVTNRPEMSQTTSVFQQESNTVFNDSLKKIVEGPPNDQNLKRQLELWFIFRDS